MSSPSTSPSTPSLPRLSVIGDVIERPYGVNVKSDRDESKSARTTESSTIHAQRRTLRATSGGFPSVSNKPIGVFAKNYSMRCNSLNENSLDIAKSVDSRADLSQMSKEEIESSIREIHSALSPEMVQFLKNRGQKKVEPIESQKERAISPPNTSLNHQPVAMVETKEKVRFSAVLSSIKTYEDLDNAYEQECAPNIDDKIFQSDKYLDGKTPWEQACILLRSTSPRQNLWAARAVCHELERRIISQGTTSNDKHKTDISFNSLKVVEGDPLLLPVSLRCLLDVSLTHANGLSLHSYVLRAIYALLRIHAPSEHVIDVTGQYWSSSAIAQLTCFVDAVPTKPYGSLYPSIVATPILKNKSGEGIVYSTSSSAVSALQDGEAFCKDPLWTLLSRMCIIPRLAQLLESHHDIPEDGLVSLCGILAMLAVRSPGAASAITQHATLFQMLMQKTILPPVSESQDSNFLRGSILLSTMILLNNLARQSRVVASAIPYLDLVPLLAIAEPSLQEGQQWGMLLGRKMLRYGLGTAAMSSLIALSIRPLSERHHCLAPLYCSIFASYLDCSKVVAKKSDDDIKAKISLSDYQILESALKWTFPSVRQVIKMLGDIENMASTTLHSSVLAYYAGLLRLISSYYSSWLTWNLNDDDDLIPQSHPFHEFPLLSILEKILDGNLLTAILPIALRHEKQGEEVSPESGLFSFLTELIALASVLDSDFFKHIDSAVVPFLIKLRKLLLKNIAECSQSYIEHWKESDGVIWRIKFHFSAARFLLGGTYETVMDSTLVRHFTMLLIGTLEVGDEAQAAILLSNDYLFCNKNDTSSPLSSWFMSELCNSETSRKQLDHSFKLHRGYGITSQGWGPFSLESLLSEAERPPGSEVGLLPLGKLWRWQALSYSRDFESEVDDETSEQSITVISHVLNFLIRSEEELGHIGFQFDPATKGAKVYFLLNVFLYPEHMFSTFEIRNTTMNLLESLSLNIGSDFVSEFSSACLDHSRLKRPHRNEQADGDKQKLLSMFRGDSEVLSASLPAVEEFARDICSSFIAYGAQYEEFTKAIRILLIPQFPAKVRCEVLKRIRELSHLLTLEAELGNPAQLGMAVSDCILERLPPKGERDSPDLLDVLTDILRQGQGGLQGYFFVMSVSTLVRALLGAIRSSHGIKGMQRRIFRLPTFVQNVISTSASNLAIKGNDMTKSDLVESVLSAMHSCQPDACDVEERQFEQWIESIKRI
jgi:RPAP1-like, N-terminal